MQILLPTLYSLIFVILIGRMDFFYIKELSRQKIILVFLLKIIAGIFAWWVYTYYYANGDMHLFFRNGEVLHSLFLKSPKEFYNVIFDNQPLDKLLGWNSMYESSIFNDSRTISILSMMIRFFSFGYFHVHTVFMCFISLLGLTALFKTFIKYFLDKKELLFYSVFLFPSVLFWTSGVLKEGLLFFALGTLLYNSNCGINTNYSWNKLFFIALSIFIFIVLKFYILIAILPGILFNFLISKTSSNGLILKYILASFVLGLLIFIISSINSDLNPIKIISEKQAKAISEAKGGVFLENNKHFVRVDYLIKNKILRKIAPPYYTIIKNSSYMQWRLDNMNDTTFVKNSNDTSKYSIAYSIVPANTRIEIDRIQPNLISILKILPKSIYNVLFSPFLWNTKNKIQLLSACENCFMLFLFIVVLLFFKKKTQEKQLVIFCLSFVVLLYSLIGITTPTIGSISRYRTPGIPFLLMILLIYFDINKFKRFLSRLPYEFQRIK